MFEFSPSWSPSSSPSPSPLSTRASSFSAASSGSLSSRASSISSSSSLSSSSSSLSSLESIQSLHLPRIICLHGGGVSARIFRAQCRELIRRLDQFRLVFVDAPFLSQPGPGILPTYGSWGPFRRWLRWDASDPAIDDGEATRAIVDAVEDCKARDAGTGDWVGILGFSQGAKIAASMLYQQQMEVERMGQAATDYKFGVLMAGRGPLVALHPESDGESYSNSTSCAALVGAGSMSVMEWRSEGVVVSQLRLPTIHVHGLKDPGLEWHRHLMVDYCEMDSGVTTLVEWDGNHRIPLKRKDVESVVEQVYRVARDEGVDV